LQLIIRGCTIRNLAIIPQETMTIGVVNSTFDPPLSGVADYIMPPSPNCGVEIAHELLCDPRARCESAPSGGVQCSCVGTGLRYKPGVPEDGRQCEQEQSIIMLLQSQNVSMTAAKPSNGSSSAVRIVVQVAGESRITAQYSAAMVRRSEAAGDGYKQKSNRTWGRLDEPRLSLDGHHIDWSTVSPANDSVIELGSGSQRYAVK
jgi:hypothetical protein